MDGSIIDCDCGRDYCLDRGLLSRVLGGVTLVRGFDPDDTTVGLGLAIGF